MKKGWVAGAISGVLILAMWAFAGPQQIGGPVGYVIVHGTSMEPGMHEGDLVLAKDSGEYEIGDVVAYDSAKLGTIVLHRIIDIDADGRYIFQGDNNDFVDSEKVAPEDLRGQMWIRVPGAGKFLALLQGPRLIVIFGVAALGYFLMRKRDDEEEAGSFSPADWGINPHVGMVAAATGALVFALIGGIAITRPTTVTNDTEVPFEHSASFAYSSSAPAGPVYQDGRVDTGEPVYLRLTETVDFRFNYAFKTRAEHDVTTTGFLMANVRDADGWNRNIRIGDEVTSTKGRVALEGRLDLGAIRQLTQEMQRATGSVNTLYTIFVRPELHTTGTVAGQEIEERFVPRLSFDLDEVKLKPLILAETEDDTTPLEPRQSLSVSFPTTAPSALTFAGITTDVSTLRTAALAGLLLSLTALALFYMWGRIAAGTDEVAQIATRYGSWMVSVTKVTIADDAEVIDMASMEDLVKIAGHHQRMILHEQDGPEHLYMLEVGGMLYRYRAIAGLERAAAADAAPKPART